MSGGSLELSLLKLNSFPSESAVALLEAGMVQMEETYLELVNSASKDNRALMHNRNPDFNTVSTCSSMRSCNVFLQ